MKMANRLIQNDKKSGLNFMNKIMLTKNITFVFAVSSWHCLSTKINQSQVERQNKMGDCKHGQLEK